MPRVMRCVTWIDGWIVPVRYPIVVADECHALKSPDAKRSKVKCRPLPSLDWRAEETVFPSPLRIGSHSQRVVGLNMDVVFREFLDDM